MIAINPLQERGLERFTAPQNPFEMLTNSETQLASDLYNVRIGGDMALRQGMMRLLIERDDAASAAGRPHCWMTNLFKRIPSALTSYAVTFSIPSGKISNVFLD